MDLKILAEAMVKGCANKAELELLVGKLQTMTQRLLDEVNGLFGADQPLQTQAATARFVAICDLRVAIARARQD